MQRFLPGFIAALVSLTFASAPARADVPWGYSSTDDTITSGDSSILFKGTSGGGVGDSGIVLYNLILSSSAKGSGDVFAAEKYNLAVTFTDINSTGDITGKSIDTVKYSGEFSASKSSKDGFIFTNNTYTSPTSQGVVLGSDASGWREYRLELLSFTPPGVSSGAGSIYGQLTITEREGPGSGEGSSGEIDEPLPPNDTPEPATLILAALGLPALGMMYGRRQKRAV